MEQTTTRAATEDGAAAPEQFLTFLLGQEMFAVSIAGIREIIEHRQPTEVPMMPAALLGVINLRGAVVPVIDLQQRFGRSPSQIGKRSCIVIVEVSSEGERHVLGLLVDAVSAVLDIPPTDIAPAPSFGAGIRRDFIRGMGKVGDRFVIVLDADAALAPHEFATLAAAADPVGCAA